MLPMLKWLHDKQQALKGRLPGTFIHRIFGDHLFSASLWVHDKRAVAGGVALGLFVAFTPTVPLQMLLAACGAVYLRVNLPLALAACWVTNPVTMVPIFLFARRIGRFILEEVDLIEDLFGFFAEEVRLGFLLRQSSYLWTGSLILSVLASAAGYFAAGLLWTFLASVVEKTKRRSTD